MTTVHVPPAVPAVLTEPAAEAWLPRTCFKTGPPERVGVELEFLLRDPDDPLRDTSPAARDVARTAESRDLRGTVTIEPGGQVEISSPPAEGLLPGLGHAEHDLGILTAAAREHGLELDGTAVDPLRPPRRLLQHPRYAAMESHLDGWGFPGRTMMCSTTSIQVNLEASRPGHEGELAERWDLLHLLRAPLVAAFANSPFRLGRPTGWKSTRQAVWLALDPGRTRGPCVEDPAVGPEAEWTCWVLDTELLCVRREHGPWTAPRGVTFRDWLRGGEAAVPGRPGPTEDDLAYHLTTLFPPVRARGFLEVRYLDAQPGPFWRVPAAVLVALTEDAAAAAAARAAAEPVRGRVVEAARSGLEQPDLARAAEAVLTAAVTALRARPAWAPAAGLLEDYLERWTLRGRTPADDLLEPGAAARDHGGVPC